MRAGRRLCRDGEGVQHACQLCIEAVWICAQGKAGHANHGGALNGELVRAPLVVFAHVCVQVLKPIDLNDQPLVANHELAIGVAGATLGVAAQDLAKRRGKLPPSALGGEVEFID